MKSWKGKKRHSKELQNSLVSMFYIEINDINF